MNLSGYNHITINVELGAFYCVHCKFGYTMAMPAPVTIIVAAKREFERLHRNCKGVTQ